MRYIFECPNLELQFDLDRPLEHDNLDEEEILECFRDAMDENGEMNYLWDIVLDAVSDFEPVALGSFDLEEADAALQKIAIKNLEKIRSDNSVFITLQDEAENIVETKAISYFPILQDMLEEDEGSGEWYSRVSGYIERNLRKFVEDSTWHYGLLQESGEIIEDELEWPEPEEGEQEYFWDDRMRPIIWFGTRGEKPDSHWIYWVKGMEESPDVWSADFPGEIMEALADNVNDAFLTWYVSECGCFVPDIRKILDRCPVLADSRNSAEENNVIFEEFFYQQWKEVNESETLNQEIADGMMQGFYQ